MDQDLRAEQPAEDGVLRPVPINTVSNIVFGPPGRDRSQRRISQKNIILVSDIEPPTAEALEAVDNIPRRQSARQEEGSEDELSREDHDFAKIS